MCYDVSFTTKIESLADYFPDIVHEGRTTLDLGQSDVIRGHDHKPHPVLLRSKKDSRIHMADFEWGCIPSDIKDTTRFKRDSMLVIRSERVLDEKSSYWHKIRHQRCLVPVTAVYEHREVNGFANKIPYNIHLTSSELFFLPGLYSIARVKNYTTGQADPRWTFGIITTKANSLMREIHNSGDNPYRMPLFLHRIQAERFLSPDLSEAEYRSLLDYKMPASGLECWPVYSVRGKKPRPDGKNRHEPFDWGFRLTSPVVTRAEETLLRA